MRAHSPRVPFIGLLIGAVLATAAVAQHAAPYAGQDARQIKSLSQEDIQQLLAGGGWGFAKPAELSGYPGPFHVLELADKLQLSKSQHRKIKSIYETMNQQARKLGASFVAAEKSLSEAFTSGQLSPDRLKALLEESGRLRAQLREIHLAAHLATKPLLSRHQIVVYAQLRGYSGAAGHQHHKQ